MSEKVKVSLASIRQTVGLTQNELVDLVNSTYRTECKPKVVSLNTVKSAEHSRGYISQVMAYRIINVINMKLLELKIKKKYTIQDIDWNISEKKGR